MKFPTASFLIALAATGHLRAADAAPAAAAAPVDVKTTHPAAPDANTSLQAIGRTAPMKQASLFSRATGIISECRVDIGDRVKEGDVLAVIAAPEIAHEIAAAQAKVEQMKARKDLAGSLLARGESLIASNAFSKETLDERRSTTKTADADVAAAEADLNTLVELQNFLTIRAPFDGTITSRRIDRGDHVVRDQASDDAWLFQIAQLRDLRMVLTVPPSTALQIRNDEAADVTFTELPGRVFAAKVARSSGLIDPQSGTMQVELNLPNADFVLPAGLSGIARIKSASAANVLMIPSNALSTRNGVPNVALVDNGKVKFQAVKPGRTMGPKVEVLSGLTADGEVILSPNSLLREGDPVNATPMAAVVKK
jgi:RND family efflux transporter MFP subunit